MQISAIVALSSISLQMFVKYYGRDMSIKKEKARARERRVNKRTGDMLILRCLLEKCVNILGSSLRRI